MKCLVTILMAAGVLLATGASQGALTDNMVALYHFDGNFTDSADGETAVSIGTATLQTVHLGF